MCGGFLGGLLNTVTMGLLGKNPAEESAKRQAAAASAKLESQEKARKAAEELKRKQRKATQTILTSGQGLAGTGETTLG